MSVGEDRSQQTINALVRRAQQGDRAAFGSLVRLFERRVYGYVARMVNNPDVAAELAQDGFLKALEALASFEPTAAFEPWLLRIVRNRVYDYLRRHRMGLVVADSDTIGRAGTREFAPDVQAESRALGRRIEDALARLSPTYRESVVLRLLSDLSFAEMADITGQTEGGAKARFVRARLQLREILSQDGG